MHCSAAWEAENRKMDHVGSAGTTYCTPLIVGKNATSIITYIQYFFKKKFVLYLKVDTLGHLLIDFLKKILITNL